MTPEQPRHGEQPLLQTKVVVPQIPPEYVPRPRLTERIERGVKGPLTLLAIPVGFGKTNLLIEWAKQTNSSVAWLNVDGEDNDVSRFFRYMIGALQVVFPGMAEETLDFILSNKAGGVQIGLTLLINEIAEVPEEIVLILDDFQNLENATILSNLDFLLKHIPQNLHLIIASRKMPELDLTPLRAKGLVVELSVHHLRFSSNEVALFCQQVMGLKLPPETIQALEKRTDGWVTALQMAAVSMGDHTDPSTLFTSMGGDTHYLVDYLAEEVLDQQPDEVRQFLLRSSVLDTLNSSLVEAVVKPEAKTGYGTVMLNRLERSHLFITALDEKREWLRYHQLFADILRHIHAEINPEEIPMLKKRAALWFEQNNNLDESFRYALSSGDIEWTANLIERNIQTMIQTGEIFPLTHWISKLPPQTVHNHLNLSLGYAWGAIATYQLDLAQDLINDVKNSLPHEQDGKIGKTPSGSQEFEDYGLWNIYGALAVIESTLALLNGEIEEATELSKKASNYFQEENPFIRSLVALDNSLYFVFSGDTQKAISSLRETIRIARQANNLLVLIIATCQMADMQVLQGQISLAWTTLQKAQFLAIGSEGQQLPLAGLVDLSQGAILLERDQLDEAGTSLERGCRIAQSLWSISNLDGLISLAHLRQIQGDIAGSKLIIGEAARMALSTESSQWDDSIVFAVGVRLALLRDDLVEAEQWWIKGGFPDLTEVIALENYPYHVFEYLTLTQARFLLVRGQDTNNESDLRRSLELLKALLLEVEKFQRISSRIEIYLLQAMAYDFLGDEIALHILQSALAMGEPEGYRRIYLDEGSRLYDLLVRCQTAQEKSNSYLPSASFIDSLLQSIQHDDQPHRVQHLSSAIAPEVRTTTVDGGFAISLSSREIEVLNLIAEGKSNKEISAELYLALNTVKRHAYNIYNKLDVSRRTQAVSKARQLGLIP